MALVEIRDVTKSFQRDAERRPLVERIAERPHPVGSAANADVRAVYLGAGSAGEGGVIAAASPGTLLIDSSTIDVASAREVAAAARRDADTIHHAARDWRKCCHSDFDVPSFEISRREGKSSAANMECCAE